MGHILMDGMPTIESDGHIIALGRPLHICSTFFLHTRFVAGGGSRIRFWENLWWGDQPLCLQFSSLLRVTTFKNCSISTILGNNISLFWDLTFRCNLTNIEIEDLERLMSLLSNFHLSPSIPDVRS